MQASTILQHRPASSSCPSGAYFTMHFHASKHGRDWIIYRTGVGPVRNEFTVKQAKQTLLDLEAKYQSQAE